MDWLNLENADELPSPSLVIYEEWAEENIRRMITMAGGPERLRPHVKTHKLPQLIYRQLALGITKFKCATIAEAEMLALSGATDILLAVQPVGANAVRFAQLISRFAHVQFTTLVDDSGVLHMLGEVAGAAGIEIRLMVDLDVGQHRTGIAPDSQAAELYREIDGHPDLLAAGLHAYDGHLHQTDVAERTLACDAAFAPVETLRNELIADGLEVQEIVVGGSPTFPIHARRSDVTCSPGTCILWDAGYAKKLPDLDFLLAAALVARVISKPSANRLSLDLGHKAVASEMPHPRVIFPAIPDASAMMHNEEHLVIETALAETFGVGQVIFGIPWHICPTVALHSEVWIARDGAIAEAWPVVGRNRRLSI